MSCVFISCKFTIKCAHLGYDALIDMFQYENNVYELCDVCKELIRSGIKVSEVVLNVLKMNPLATIHLYIK